MTRPPSVTPTRMIRTAVSAAALALAAGCAPPADTPPITAVRGAVYTDSYTCGSTSDDQAAIQTKLDAFATDQLAVLTISPGMGGAPCALDNFIAIRRSHLWIKGSSPPPTLKAAHPTDSIRLITNQGLSAGLTNVTISDLILDGSRGDYAPNEHADGIYLEDLQDSTVTRVTVHHTPGDGIYFHAAHEWGPSVNVAATDSYTHDGGRVGINFDGVTRSKFVGNRMDGHVWGLKAEDTADSHLKEIVVADNVVTSTSGVPTAGMAFGNQAGNSDNYHDVVVSGNRLDVGNSVGIQTHESSHIVLHNNSIDLAWNEGEGCTGGGVPIYLLRNVRQVSIAGNTIRNLNEGCLAQFCSGPINDSFEAITIGGGPSAYPVVGVSVHGNTLRNVVTGVGTHDSGYGVDAVSVIANTMSGTVGSGSMQLHRGFLGRTGLDLMIASNAIRGFDRQIEFDVGDDTASPSAGVHHVNIAANILRGYASGSRVAIGEQNGGSPESFGIALNAGAALRNAGVVLAANIVNSGSGDATYRPFRVTTTDPNNYYQILKGETELVSNVGLGALTRPYISTSYDSNYPPGCIYPEHSPRGATETVAAAHPRRNSAGSVTLSGTNTTSSATFSGSEPDTSYRVVVTPTTQSGSPGASATRIKSVSKTTSGFSFDVETAPGTSNSVTFDWMVMR